MAKTKKHDQIRTLADAKFNTIHEYVSKAIEVSNISHEEFTLISSKLKNFDELKEKVRKSQYMNKSPGGESKQHHTVEYCFHS